MPSMILGCGLDLFLGEPDEKWHPVCWMGKLVDLADWAMPGRERDLGLQRLSGAVVALSFPLGTWLLTRKLLRSLPGPLAVLAETALISVALAPRSLYEQAVRVEDGIAIDVEQAREAVAGMVGRDTDGLDEDGIIRAAVESVAENANDGVIAPIFYGLIGGAPLAMAYRMVNTLDSMIGYQDEQYRYFGWASARLDDAAGYIPARLTALAAAAASPLVGGSPAVALAVCRNDAGRHDSPNAGVCESAFAGALGVRLGGANRYAGREVEQPVIAAVNQKPEFEDISRAARLMYASAGLVLAAGTVLRAGMAGARLFSRRRARRRGR